MSHILFELLENSGFIKGTMLNADRISRAKRSGLIDVCLQSAEITSASEASNAPSIFSHTSSLSLSGGPLPCASIDCRLSRVGQLAQFAAFYSDRVFVNNGLFTSVKKIHSTNLDVVRSAFLCELEVLLALRPLIESRLIIPVTPTTTKCFHCLGKSALSAADATKFDRALNRFAARFSKEADIKLEYTGHGEVDIHVAGNDDLVEHGSAHIGLVT